MIGLLRQAFKALTQRADDDEPPPRAKEREKLGGGFLAAKSIIKRMARRVARLSADAFANAAKAAVAPELSGWLREFFEIEADPDNPLDVSNPDRDLVLGAGEGAVFEVGYDITGPALDL